MLNGIASAPGRIQPLPRARVHPLPGTRFPGPAGGAFPLAGGRKATIAATGRGAWGGEGGERRSAPVCSVECPVARGRIGAELRQAGLSATAMADAALVTSELLRTRSCTPGRCRTPASGFPGSSPRPMWRSSSATGAARPGPGQHVRRCPRSAVAAWASWSICALAGGCARTSGAPRYGRSCPPRGTAEPDRVAAIPAGGPRPLARRRAGRPARRVLPGDGSCGPRGMQGGPQQDGGLTWRMGRNPPLGSPRPGGVTAQ